MKQWRAYYRSQPSREYDPEWIWTLFKLYFKFIAWILGPTHELVVQTAKQWGGMEIAIKKPESLHHQARRSGKTLKLSHLCVFFALLNFGPCPGKVVYRTPHAKQLKGLMQWLKLNPFYLKERKSDYEVDLFGALWPVDCACLSESTSTGLECSVLIEDEYSTIKKEHDQDLMIYVRDTRAFLAKGKIHEKRHIHASSGRKTSPFEDDYLALTAIDPTAYFQMPWWDCPWIDQAFIDKERKKMFDAQYWIQEQYECLWVLPSGMFFDQNHLHIMDPSWFAKFAPKNGGLDWNGADVGHIMGKGFWDGVNLYVWEELRFTSVQEVHNWILAHPETAVEVEGKPNQMGFNAGYSDHLMTLGTPCSYQNWGEKDENVKANRLALLHRADVYCTAACKWLVKNYIEATFDKKEKLGVPTLEKTPSQHGLDYALHMIHGRDGIDTVNSTPSYKAQEFDNMIDSIPFRSRI